MNFIFIRWGWGLQGIAAGMVFGFIVCGLGFYAVAVKQFAKGREVVREISRVCFLWILFFIIIYGLDWSIKIHGHIFLETGLKLAVFVLCSLPFFYYLEKKERMLRHIVGSFSQRFFADKEE